MASLLRILVASVALSGLACDDPYLPPDGPTSSSTGGGDPEGGGGQGGSGGGGGALGPCRTLTASETSIYFGSAAMFGLEARVDVDLVGYAKTRLTLELYQETIEPLAPGTFDLSLSPDDSYATCEHCVLLVAYDEAGQPRRAFFQSSGSMTLTKTGAEEFGVAAGDVSDVRLVEVTQNPDFSWNVVPGGECFDLAAWSFDTTVVHGGPCDTVEDCPNEAMQTCDVETKTCQPGECSLFGDPPVCDAGYRCMSQVGALIDREEIGPALGACYPTCEPDGAGSQGDCDGSSTCFALDATQSNGVCLAVGGPAIGEACTLSDVATGCGEGALCAGEPPTCHAICDYLTPQSGCPDDTYCSVLNLCEPLDVGDLSPVGGQCGPGAATLTDCGPEGDAFRGLCFRLFESEADSTCERVCRMADPDCPAGLSCVGVFTNTDVGICADPGACGDGTLDLLGAEQCDDGNTVSGDGCSADCSAAELAPLCALAIPLGASDAVVGSNEGGVTGYTSQCDPFVATPVATYAFTPPAPGELKLTLQSLADMNLSVLADCADAASEQKCRSGEGDVTLRVNFPAVPAEPALVVVRGATPLETGLFILEAEFAVASCGDGQLNGPEVCDDGNTAGGDGCSADCATLDWSAVCSALPALSLDQALDLDLDVGSTFFDLTAICSFESGRERAFSFVAPADGTLTVTASSDDDVSVYVRDGCGPIDESTFVACGNFAPAGDDDTAVASLTAGQAVTVIVDGFTREDAGPVTLLASFEP